MTLIPTPEQQAIIDFARSDKRSLLVNALAGSAKTTTLVMIAHALPVVPVLCLAFNKRIAVEMEKRMPGHIKTQTINSLGHGVWSRSIGKRLVVDTHKNYNIIREVIDTYKGDDKGSLIEAFSSILRAIGLAKSSGYVPPNWRSINKGLLSDGELYDVLAPQLDDEPNSLMLRVIDQVLDRSIKMAFSGVIDFDDQVYMSALFSDSFPKYPIVMVDEAQDLSPLNHIILQKLRPDRLIAVGDPWQSIYHFRGADQYSMRNLKETFHMEEKTLSISFRCPIAAVKRAHFRVPHMRWWEKAEEGEIIRLTDWSSSDIPSDTAVLCRNNAPLFGCALRFISAGRSVTIVGGDLGPGLIKTLKKLGPASLKQEEVLKAIDKWVEEALAKAQDARRPIIHDKAECLRVFASFGKTLDEAIAYAELMFDSSGALPMMTGHKAKGLEFDNILIIDPWRIPSKYAKIAAEMGDRTQLEQELNLRYVMETRWKKKLFLADLEKMA